MIEALKNPLAQPTTVGGVSYSNLQGNFRFTKEQLELLGDIAKTMPNPNKPIKTKREKVRTDKPKAAHGQV